MLKYSCSFFMNDANIPSARLSVTVKHYFPAKCACLNGQNVLSAPE